MIFLIMVSFIWAFSFVLIKGNLIGLDSNFVSFIRLGLSLLVFLPFLKVNKIEWSDKIKLMAIGAVQFGLMYIAYIASYQYLPAHMIALLTTTTPIFVTLFNDIYTRKFHWLFLLSALLAVAAGIVIKYPNQALEASFKGVLLIQLSNIAFAFGQLYYKKLTKINSDWKDKNIFGLLYLGGVIITGIFSAFTTNFAKLVIAPKQVLTLIYLGVIASGLCFFLWNKGAKSVNEGTLAIMNNLKIPLAIIASLLILQEKTDYIRLIVGCVLMFTAIYLNEKLRVATYRPKDN